MQLLTENPQAMVLAAFATIITQPAQVAHCITFLCRIQGDDLYRIAACTWICNNLGVFENEGICGDFCDYALSLLHAVITSCDQNSPDFGILRSNCVELVCSICAVFGQNPSYFESPMIQGKAENLYEPHKRGIMELCLNPASWKVSEEIENCGVLPEARIENAKSPVKSDESTERTKNENNIVEVVKETISKPSKKSKSSLHRRVRADKQIHTGFTDDENSDQERPLRGRRLGVISFEAKLDESVESPKLPVASPKPPVTSPLLDNQTQRGSKELNDNLMVNEVSTTNEMPIVTETSVTNETPKITETPIPTETSIPTEIPILTSTKPVNEDWDDWDDELPIQPAKKTLTENWDESTSSEERTPHINDETPLRSSPSESLHLFSSTDPFLHSPLTQTHNEAPAVGSRLWIVLRSVKECWSNCVKEELSLLKALLIVSEAEIIKEYVMAKMVTILSSQVLTEIDMNSVKECLQLLKSELAFRAGSDLSVKHLRELQTVTSIRQLVKMNLIGYELMPVNWLFNNLTEIMLILFSPSSAPDCIKVSLEVYVSVLTGLSETHRDLLLKVTSLNVFLVVPPVIPMMNGDELMCLLSVCERVSEGDGLEVSVRTCVRMSINPLCDQNAVMQFLTNLTNYHKDAMKEVVLKMSQSERLIIKELLNRGMKEKDQKRRNKPIRLDFSHL